MDRPVEVNTPVRPQPNPEKQKTIEVVLPGERYSEVSFSFKVPGWDNLAASANRLLKFEFPAIRDVKVYERLIKTNVVSTGLSKKVLETLPLPFLEQIYQALWQPYFPTTNSILNTWLTLFLLIEEMSEFDVSQMVFQDIELLGQRDAGTMHSYYYRGPLNRDNMIAFLAGHGYRTDFLSQVDEADEQALQFAYLACRRLNQPLPWAELLETLSAMDLEKYTRLARLKAVQALLGEQTWFSKAPITPQNFRQAAQSLGLLLVHEEMGRIASRCGISRPIRELVIVEGETEKLLLPLFAQSMHLDFNASGIGILPAGGKNHVLSLYGEHARYLHAPICVLLDSDAQEIADEIRLNLRPHDYVFQIAEGEFEDLYDMDLILKTINLNYQPYPEVTTSRFQELATFHNTRGRVQTLKALWQSYNLGSFDKIEFAGKYADILIPSPSGGERIQPPAAIRRLIETILAVRRGQK